MSRGKAEEMFRKNAYQSEAPQTESLRFADPAVPSRSCCCPARPAVKVVMPPVGGRPHSVDLWLCGHHYRASRAALTAAGARAEYLTEMAAELPPADHARVLLA